MVCLHPSSIVFPCLVAMLLIIINTNGFSTGSEFGKPGSPARRFIFATVSIKRLANIPGAHPDSVCLKNQDPYESFIITPNRYLCFLRLLKLHIFGHLNNVNCLGKPIWDLKMQCLNNVQIKINNAPLCTGTFGRGKQSWGCALWCCET